MPKYDTSDDASEGQTLFLLYIVMKVDAVHTYFKMSLHSKACIQNFISLPVLLHG